jgi:hypothetical protein
MWPFKGKGKSEKQVKKEEVKAKNGLAETKSKENKKDKKESHNYPTNYVLDIVRKICDISLYISVL